MSSKSIKRITNKLREKFSEKCKGRKIGIGEYLDFQLALKELEKVLKRVDERADLWMLHRLNIPVSGTAARIGTLF